MRKKFYILLRKTEDGGYEGLADTSVCTVDFRKGIAIRFREPPLHYLYMDKKAFIARVNSNSCPVIVDFKDTAVPRYTKGNLYFKTKAIAE